MNSHDLLPVFESLSRPKILVLGDLMLDRYTWGNADRISQEAPVIVLRADRREARPGGAANVANMLLGLGASVSCFGVVGDDTSGSELRQLLLAAGVEGDGLLTDRRRPTTVKERFVGRASSRHPSQILRVDHEQCDPLCEALETEIIRQLNAQIPKYDAVLISDYGKGVCTSRVVESAIAMARWAGIRVLVDPSRDCPLDRYRGATFIKPNRLETELATGLKISGPADAREAGRRLCNEMAAEMALITLDRDGMLLVGRDGAGELFPTHARQVYDITGAGDMVMAMFALALASGTSVADAARLANVAAGLEVERSGVAVIRRDEIRAELVSGRSGFGSKIITRHQAAMLADQQRMSGNCIVFTNGCFDLLHVGHVTFLAQASRQGDVLIVGVNSDASVHRLKGPGRPVISQGDRASMLAALAEVDFVVIFDEDTPLELLEAIRPDVLVKGGDYVPHQIVGYDLVTSYGGQVLVTGMVDGISTSRILASLERGETIASDTPPPPMRKAS